MLPRSQLILQDLKRVYQSSDLAPGDSIIFAATGVTTGALLKGVRFFGEGVRTHSVIMQTNPYQIRFVDSIHVEYSETVRVQF